MKEIGGFFQLEAGMHPLLHEGASLLNSGRNALRCIIRDMKIRKIRVPYYSCPVVWHALEAEHCEIIPYEVDASFMPLCEPSEIPLLYTNYFGVCTDNARSLKKSFPCLILDNAQAFYARPDGTACFWSPRKFFGLPDGGMMWPAHKSADDLPVSESWQRCSHLLKRWDLGAGAAYADFKLNSADLGAEPPLAMSILTHALMSSLDCEAARQRRRENFSILHKSLGERNLLGIDLNRSLEGGDVPLVYPFRTKDEELRRRLIQNKVFVATYWPQEEGCSCMSSPSAQAYAREIIPLPIDQRYGRDDMLYILEDMWK